MTHIIVFDTGTGGKIFADHFRYELPANAKIIEIIDRINSPYGSKSPSQILTLTENAIKPYLDQPNNIIVLACNTATSYALSYLRTKYPNQTFIGTEPAIKPASQFTKTGGILILATPATLKSAYYQNLKAKFAPNIRVYEPNCANWATQIDTNKLTPQIIDATLTHYKSYSLDAIVLACTHFLAIPPSHLTDIFPKATIYSPLPAITDHLKALLLPPQTDLPAPHN